MSPLVLVVLAQFARSADGGITEFPAQAPQPRSPPALVISPFRGSIGSSCVPALLGSAFAGEWSTHSWFAGSTVTVTANAGSGPPGSCSTAATRLQVTATTTAQYGGIADQMPPTNSDTQMLPCQGGTQNISWGFWVLSASGNSFDICTNDNLHNEQCHTCAPAAGTWTFCKVENQTWWLTTNSFSIGNLSLLSGVARPSALDVQIYAPRCVIASTISP